MKRITACVIVCVALVIPAFSEDAGEQAVSNSDIMKSIEEINQRLNGISISPKPPEGSSFNVGISLLAPLFIPEMYKLNDYLAGQGSFEPMNWYNIPFLNGIGVSAIYKDARTKQLAIIGKLKYWTQASQGFLYHSQNPLYPDSLVDADGDGLADYTSNISYAMSTLNLGASYEIEVAKGAFSFTPSLMVGLGADSVKTSEWGEPSLGLFSSNPTWEKLFLSFSGGLAVNIFGLEIGGSFDYHVDLESWQPRSGVKPGTSPAADFNSMNVEVWVNPIGLFMKK